MKIIQKSEDGKTFIPYPVCKYLIPFRFNKKSMGSIVEKLSGSGWKSKNELSENEFLPYIKHILDQTKTEIICHRLIHTREKTKILFDEKVTKNRTAIGTLESDEVFLFKTGAGFYTFDVCFPELSCLNDLIIWSNHIKDISHNRIHIQKEKEETIVFCDDMTLSDDEEEHVSAIDYTRNRTSVKIPKKFLPGINNEGEVKITKGSNKQPIIRYSTTSCVNIHTFIENELAEVEDIAYFNEFVYDIDKKSMASKANLFIACLVEKTEDKNALMGNAFLLSRGYKGSYKKTIAQENNNVFSTFDNMYWAVSREGVANLISLVDDETTNQFLTGTYRNRLQNYFFLYILALHQYYGLLKLAQDISDLPSSVRDYLNHDDNYQKLLDTYDNINFMYLKCVYHEVTHISHKAQVYHELYDVLGIDSLLNEVNYEMDRLTGIVNQIRNSSQQEEFRKQQEQWERENTERENRKRENEERDKQEACEQEMRSNRERIYAIIGGIFAFFSVVEALWSITVLSDLTGILNLQINNTIVQMTFVFGLIFIGIVIGAIIYVCWLKSLNEQKKKL